MTPVEPSLTDTIDQLRARGYGADFSAVEGGLRCGACGQAHDPVDARIDEIVRFEGNSNPDDEAAIYALRCLHCGTLGVLVTAFGPTASAEEAAVLVALAEAGHPR